MAETTAPKKRTTAKKTTAKPRTAAARSTSARKGATTRGVNRTKAAAKTTVKDTKNVRVDAGTTRDAAVSTGRSAVLLAGNYVERAAYVQVGAVLTARDAATATIEDLRVRIADRDAAEAELRKLEKRGEVARTRTQREVKKARTRVERELRQRRNRVAPRRQAQPHPRRARGPVAAQGRRDPDQGRPRDGQRHPDPGAAAGPGRRRPPCARSCARSWTASPRSHDALPPPGRPRRGAGRRSVLRPHTSCRRKQFLSSPRRAALTGGPSRIPARGGRICENDGMPSHDEILKSLEAVIDPELRKSIVELGMVRSIEQPGDGVVDVVVSLTTPGCPIRNHFEDAVAKAVGALEGVTRVDVAFDVLTDQEKSELQRKLGRGSLPEGALAQVANVICVGSGKGGVGKSTMTANLAAALAAEGQHGRRARRRRLRLLDPAHVRRLRPPAGLARAQDHPARVAAA